MAETEKISSMHVAMFPWFAFGHFIPYLQLSNLLAKRGYKISFLLPRSAQSKLTQLNKYPNLIHFFPLIVPNVDGLPFGAETVSDIPFSLQKQLCTAMDQTKNQVKTILETIKPNFVLYDFAFWVPSLGKELGFKSISYSIVCAALPAFYFVPSKKIIKGMTYEEMIGAPPGYPSSTVVTQSVEAVQFLAAEFGSGLSIYERFLLSKKESDAIAHRTCYEVEGPFIDYLAEQYKKPVLLTGTVLTENPESPLEEKWEKWLAKFEVGSVVYCAFGSQTVLEKDQFQELLLGFESSGLPFLAALPTPSGCSTVEEAFPVGFQERVEGRGWLYGGWVPQPQILNHRSIGCFVSHGGSSSMWESLLSDCQIVVIPANWDHSVISMLMVEELKVAVEVKREKNGWISKENLSKAIKSVMIPNNEVSMALKSNHTEWRNTLSNEQLQETYVDTFVKNLQDLNA